MHPIPSQLPPRVRLEGARFWTADRARPWVTGITIDHGRVAALDAPDDASVPRVVLREGTVVVPGLIDGHLHLSLGAQTLAQDRKSVV